jgi:hypothetical protein
MPVPETPKVSSTNPPVLRSTIPHRYLSLEPTQDHLNWCVHSGPRQDDFPRSVVVERVELCVASLAAVRRLHTTPVRGCIARRRRL